MMGFGMTDPGVWLLGVLAMIAIWGGVWWGLSTLVFHWPAHERTRSAARRQAIDEPESQPWHQPTFDSSSGPAEADPGTPRASSPPRRSYHQPHTNTESDNR